MAISRETIGLLFNIQANSAQARAEIAALRNSVNTNLAGIKAGFNALNPSLTSFGAAVNALNSPLGAITLTVAALGTVATAAAVGLFKLATEVADADNRFIKLNQRTGVSIEFLRTLSAAAIETGTGFDTVDRALDQFFSRLDKARSTQGRTRDIFAQLGFKTPADFQKAFENPTAALKQAITALGNFKTAAEFGVMAQEAFGLRNQEIAPIIRALIKDLEAYEAKVKRVYGEVTPEAERQSKLFKIQLGETTLAAQGLADVLGRSAMPALTGLTGAFKESLIAGRLFVTEVLRAIGVDAQRTTFALLYLQAQIRTMGEQGLGKTAKDAALGGVKGFIKGYDPRNWRNFVPGMKIPGQDTIGGALEGIKDNLSSFDVNKNFFEIVQEYQRQLAALSNPEGRATEPGPDKARAKKKPEMPTRGFFDLEEERRRLIDIARQRVEIQDKLRAAEEKAERESLERRDAILKEGEQNTIAAVRFAAERRQISFEAAEEAIEQTQIEAIARRRARLEEEMARLSSDSVERRRISDELILLEEQQAGATEEATRRKIEARERDIDAAKRELEEFLAITARIGELRDEIAAAAKRERFGSLLGDTLAGGTGGFDALKGAAINAFNEIGASAVNFQQLVTGSLNAVAQATEQVLANFFSTGKGGAQAFRSLAAAILASMAVQGVIKALFEYAEGTKEAALAAGAAAVGNVAGAALHTASSVKHFAAAALYTKIAAAGAIGGIALAATAGGGGAAAGGGGGAGGQQQRGNLTIEQGGDRRPILQIHLHGELGAAAIVNKVETSYKDNSSLRQTMRRDMVGD